VAEPRRSTASGRPQATGNPATVRAAAAIDSDHLLRTEIERCQQTPANCEQRLARRRAPLEAGTDPTVVAQWTSEVQAEQA
jgi:hypothetical protein